MAVPPPSGPLESAVMNRLAFFPRAALALAAPLLAGAASAQSNTDPELDVQMASIADVRVVARQGAFPNGLNAAVFATTACNVGTKVISWSAPMDPHHPFIAFLVARELNGRFEQINERAWVKHGYFAVSSTLCGTCIPPGSNGLLGIGCSDTYSVNSNGNQYYLGPPDEIDPWMGTWDPVCSYFDRGDPAVAPPNDCNGERSLTQAQASALSPLAHRIRIWDPELNAGGSFWYQGQYVLEGEGEAARGNNLGSLGFRPVWNGSAWLLQATADPLLYGTVLQRWSGASVASATNGADDGRVYVAVKVSGPDPATGFYHYEYAVHNRDNAQGVSALRIPVCTGARVRNLGFGDVDADAQNDWSGAVVADELVFSGASNPLKWNTIFNFWFDSDAAPAAGKVVLDPSLRGAGLVSVASSGPLELYNLFLGPGCALDAPPTLFAVGTPPRATLGNATFALRSTGLAALQPSWLRFSAVPGTFQQGPCTRYLGPIPGTSFLASMVLSDASGVAQHAAPVPNDLALEGLSLELQATSRDPGNGVLPFGLELSEGLRVRIGNAVSRCP